MPHNVSFCIEERLVDSETLELTIVRSPDLSIPPSDVFQLVILHILDLLVELLLLQWLFPLPLLFQLNSEQLSEFDSLYFNKDVRFLHVNKKRVLSYLCSFEDIHNYYLHKC